jgi:hypothetical protein
MPAEAAAERDIICYQKRTEEEEVRRVRGKASPCRVVPVAGMMRLTGGGWEKEAAAEFLNHCKNDLKRHAHTLGVAPYCAYPASGDAG